MTVTIGRRELLVALGCAAAAWPTAAGAEQPLKLANCRISGDNHSFGMEQVDRSIRTAAARTWLDRGPHYRHRISLGGGTP
jgi:hypothetical protein